MNEHHLEAGEIVSTHGVRGEVKIMPWADSPEFLTGFDAFYLDGIPYGIESARPHKTLLLVKFKGIDDIEAAQALRGKIIRIDRSDVVLDDDTVFIADLIGLPVFADGEPIGKIADVLSTLANDVYVVRGAHEYMIPAVPEFLEEVNVGEKVVRVRLIEGMRTDEN